ncbi:methyltransferase domain-containing protein [uncultured Tateyamaria sp.]|uniref:class I SAM-dependent methyltransferase n=1 Tax=uncultured Tateyamaria sp. TaxID=455651 RepID=UPI00262E6F9B|nr:methyltransferase domain-containing protein [uncultured Tateyamaria sp.]
MGTSHKERGEYWDSYYTAKAVPDIPSQFAAFVLSECRDADYFLDVGCGNGRDTFFFARHKMPVVSVDGSTAAISDIVERSSAQGLPIAALSAACDDPDLMDKVADAMSHIDVSGVGVIYARFFIHAITDDEQAGFLDFCGAFLKKNGGKLALEFRTAADEKLSKVTAEHYRRYVEPVDFLNELFQRGLTASYFTQGTGYAKYKDDDAFVVRMLVEQV